VVARNALPLIQLTRHSGIKNLPLENTRTSAGKNQKKRRRLRLLSSNQLQSRATDEEAMSHLIQRNPRRWPPRSTTPPPTRLAGLTRPARR
jgi:hypothetical protein